MCFANLIRVFCCCYLARSYPFALYPFRSQPMLQLEALTSRVWNM
jgi:hypothetical protein